MQWSDALGKPHGRYSGSPRIVSLVPSLTELLVALDLAEALVGRTGFCIHPRQVVRRIPKLGGTKGFNVDKLRALKPTHVLVNIDENRREEVEALADFVPHLIVTHPLTVGDNLDLYRLLGGVFGREQRAEVLCDAFEREWAALNVLAAGLARQQVLYLIWREPWLSVAATPTSRACWPQPAGIRCRTRARSATRRSICLRWLVRGDRLSFQ
jgi:ABC-type Fe3+-hydroxamate transport system substrate-binding protein